MPGGFLLDEDARSARLDSFDSWLDDQRKAVTQTVGDAAQTAGDAAQTVTQAVQAAPSAAQQAQQAAQQRFDQWFAEQQAALAASQKQAEDQAAAQQAAAQQAAQPTPPVAQAPTPTPTPAPEAAPAAAPDTTATQPAPPLSDAQQSAGQRFDSWLEQQRAGLTSSPVGQAVGGAASTVGAAAGSVLPHAEEPATATDQVTSTQPVGGPDLGKNWKTQFDFGAVYTGDYRTGTPHRGVDMVPSNGKGIGTEVDAFEPGTVTNIFRDPGGAGGLIVYVQDSDGLTHAYMHLAGTQPGLSVGTQVQRGTPIAMMGESGTEGSPHLHYEVRKNASNGDPLNQLIDPRPYVSGDKQPSGTPTSPTAPVTAPLRTTQDQTAADTAPPDRSMSLQDYARAAARRAGIDPNVFYAQIQQESGFNPTAKSPAGATGIAQFMPATAAGLKLDPTDPYASLDAAAQMDAQNLSKYKGDWNKTLAAYNAGGGAVDQYGGVPPYKETQSYVQTIMGNAQKAADAAGTAISSAVQQGQQAVGAAAGAVGGAVGAAASATGTAARAALDAATAGSVAARAQAEGLVNQGKTQLQQLQDQTAQLQQQLDDSRKRLQAAQDDAAKQAQQFTSNIQQNYLQPRDFSGITNQAAQIGQDVMNSGPAQAAGRAVGSAFDQAPSPLGGTLGSNVRDVQQGIQEAPSNLQNLGQGLQAANTEAQRQEGQDSVLTTAARSGMNLAGRDLSPEAAQALNTATPPMLRQADAGGAISSFLKAGNIVPASQTVNLPFIGATPVADIVGLAANLVVPMGAEERFASSASQRALDRAAFEVVQRTGTGMLERPGVQAAWSAALGSKIGEGSTAARMAVSGMGRWARASVQEIASDLAQGPIGKMVTDETGTLDVDKLTQIAQKVKDEMVRMYHGTGTGFASVDPARMAGEENLYGPGHYLTSDPRVAGGVVSEGGEQVGPSWLVSNVKREGGQVIQPGYAQQRAVQEGLAPEQRVDLQRRVDLARQTLAGNPSPDLRAYVEKDLAEAQGKLDSDLRGAGANVRPVNVPKDLNLLDADAPLPPEHAQAIGKALGYAPDDPEVLAWSQPGVDGESVYNLIRGEVGGSKTEANKVLAEAGFDGISYSGGQRIPMNDASGMPIEHQATVVFPESVSKVRNALSDEAGSVGLNAGMRLGGGAAGLLGSENTMSPEDKQDPWGRFSRDLGATLLGAAAPGVIGAVARGGGVSYRDLAAVRPAVGPPLTRGPQTLAQNVSAYTKGNLLSGLKTHVTNIASQLVELAHQPLSSLASGREDDAVAGIKASAQAVPDALRNFAKTLSTGETQFTQSQGATSAWLPALRLLGATDDFFRTIGWAMGAGQEGQRVLREGGATAASASSILGSNATRISEAGDKAGAMSVFGEGAGPGHAISSLKNRLLGSSNYGDQLKGMLLDAGVPFAAVPGRIWHTGIARTPGIGELNALRKAGIAIKAGDQKAFQKAMGDAAVQSVISASILSNVFKGNIRGPDDKEHPSGIKINGQWFDYSGWGPWVLPMSIPAALVEAQQKEGNKPNPDMPKAWANALGKTLSNQFYAADIIKTLNQVGEGNTTGAAGSLAQGYVDRYLPAGALMNTATQLWDPVLRDPSNEGLRAFVEREQAKVPGLESKLPAKPNMLTGEPEQRTSSGPGQLIGMQTRDRGPLYTEIARLERSNYSISDPTKVPTDISLRGHSIHLTEEEGRKLAVERGKLINEALGPMVAGKEWQQMTDNDRAMTLNRVIARIDGRNAALWAGMTPDAEVERRVGAGTTVAGKLEPTPAPVLAGSR